MQCTLGFYRLHISSHTGIISPSQFSPNVKFPRYISIRSQFGRIFIIIPSIVQIFLLSCNFSSNFGKQISKRNAFICGHLLYTGNSDKHIFIMIESLLYIVLQNGIAIQLTPSYIGSRRICSNCTIKIFRHSHFGLFILLSYFTRAKQHQRHCQYIFKLSHYHSF